MTPDDKLLVQIFEGKEVRIIDHENDTWIPLADLATAWGIDRSTPDKIIERNGEAFFNLSSIVLDAQSTPMRCLNERGLYLMMGRIEARRLKNKDAKKTIIRFQRWFPELIQKFRKKELVQTTLIVRSSVDIVNECLDIADIAVERSGVPKEIAHSMAWTLAGNKTELEFCNSVAGYIKAQTPETKQLLLEEAIPQDKADYDMYFSLTKVAAALKLPIDKVRNVLESLNVIYFENGYWKLGKNGEKYGKVFMVMPGYPYRMNQRAYIKYNPEVFVLLRKHFDIELPVTRVQE